jgi:hypothetical protein
VIIYWAFIGKNIVRWGYKIFPWVFKELRLRDIESGDVCIVESNFFLKADLINSSFVERMDEVNASNNVFISSLIREDTSETVRILGRSSSLGASSWGEGPSREI